jgi:predicted amidophosphoribosyltransferase
MKQMLGPRIVYWLGFAMTVVGLFYALTGITNQLGLVNRSYTQTGGAGFALLGVLAMMVGKAWMDAIVRSRGRVSCAECNRFVQASLPRCSYCGAPLRTTSTILRLLSDSSIAAQSQSLFCSGCGSQAASSASFCRSCGQPLVPLSAAA